MEIVFTPKIDDVRKAMDDIERRAREGIHVGFMAPTGTAGGGLSGGVGLPNSSAILGQSPPATANPLRGLTDAQSDRRFRSQIAYDVSTMAGDPLRQAQTLNEAAGSFEPGTVDNLRYRTAANRASSRHFAGEERTFNQGIKELARQEARAIGRRADAPEGFWGGEPNAPEESTRAKSVAAGGGGGGTRIFGINPYGGFGRYMSAGFLLRASAGSVEAGRDFGVASMLSGGDQEQQLTATLEYRNSIARSWGFIGQGVAFAQDPTGSQEAGVRAQLQSAQVAKSSIALAVRLGDVTRGVRNEYEVAREHDPVQKKLTKIDAEEADRRAGFAKLRTAAGEQTNAEVTDLKARQAADREEDVRKEILRGGRNVVVTAGTGGGGVSIQNNISQEEGERRVDERNAKAQDALRSSASKRRGDEINAAEELSGKKAGDERREVWRDENFRGRIMAAQFSGEEAVHAAVMSGDAGAARVASIRAANREEELRAEQGRDPRLGDIQRQGARRVVMAEQVNERERQLDVADLAGQSRAARNYDPGNPLANQLAAIDEKAARATRRDKRPGMAAAFEEERVAEREQAEREENYEKRYRRAELTAERRGLEREVAGNFLAAQSGREADASRRESSRLREKKDFVGADMVLGNAVLQQQAMRTRILQTFEGREIDINRTALSGPRGGEDPIEALHTIADEIRGLRLDQRNGVSVPAVVD
jgi:hypothetical protein